MISEAWPSPDKRMQERNQLITSFISLAVLLYFTFSFMLEAWDTVSKQGGEDESFGQEFLSQVRSDNGG